MEYTRTQRFSPIAFGLHCASARFVWALWEWSAREPKGPTRSASSAGQWLRSALSFSASQHTTRGVVVVVDGLQHEEPYGTHRETDSRKNVRQLRRFRALHSRNTASLTPLVWSHSGKQPHPCTINKLERALASYLHSRQGVRRFCRCTRVYT